MISGSHYIGPVLGYPTQGTAGLGAGKHSRPRSIEPKVSCLIGTSLAPNSSVVVAVVSMELRLKNKGKGNIPENPICDVTWSRLCQCKSEHQTDASV